MRRARLPFLPITALLAAACDSTEPSVPTTLSLTPLSISFDATGGRDTIVAEVLDQRGGRMDGISITWSVEGAAARVTPLGGDSAIVTSVRNGSAIVRASAAADVVGEAAISVVQAPTALVTMGLDQSATVGTALPHPIRVVVRDRLGAVIPGHPIQFRVTAGAGSLSTTDVLTGDDGTASANWILGTSTSSGQEVTVSAEGHPTPGYISAIATSGPAVSLAVSSGNNQSGPAGQNVPFDPAVRVSDEYGNPVPLAPVVFQVTGGGGNVFPPTGLTASNGIFAVQRWTLGAVPGPNSLRASVTDTDLAVEFGATGLNAINATIFAGGNQAAHAGESVPIDPAVIIHDSYGMPQSGMQVIFSVVLGDGVVTNEIVVSDEDGIASTGWTLGPVATRNRLFARVNQNLGVAFSASGCSGGGGVGYGITLCFNSDVTALERTLFEGASNRWSSAIAGDLPDFLVNIAAPCPGSPDLRNTTIDDLLIFVSIIPLDGPGGLLGQAGPCQVRSSNTLPLIGLMQFDQVDVRNLGTLFQPVILHEMGHVIGVGGLWDDFDLLKNPSTTNVRVDSYFSGPAAIAAFDAAGGAAYSAGQKVPVENEGGQGTINSHWRESVLRNELMTGFINSGGNPLSVVTIRSLEDMGYTVNPAAAESWSYTPFASSRSPGTEQGVRLVDDVLRIPIGVLDETGGVVEAR